MDSRLRGMTVVVQAPHPVPDPGSAHPVRDDDHAERADCSRNQDVSGVTEYSHPENGILRVVPSDQGQALIRAISDKLSVVLVLRSFSSTVQPRPTILGPYLGEV